MRRFGCAIENGCSSFRLDAVRRAKAHVLKTLNAALKNRSSTGSANRFRISARLLLELDFMLPVLLPSFFFNRGFVRSRLRFMQLGCGRFGPIENHHQKKKKKSK